jgi:hypothetical protein
VSAPAGFDRYVWSNGQEGPRLVLDPSAPGRRHVELVASRPGCQARTDLEVRVDGVAVTASAARPYACAGGTEPVDFDLTAQTLPAGAVSLAWTVDVPAVVLDPAAAATVARFPPGTPSGTYRATVVAEGEGGCRTEDSVTLHLVAEGEVAEPENTLRVRPGGAGSVQLTWTEATRLADVFRSPSKGAPGSLIGAAVEGSTLVDTPSADPGVSYYEVRPTPVCGAPLDGLE